MSSLMDILILQTSIWIRGLQQNHPQLLITYISSSYCYKIRRHSWLRWSHGLCLTACWIFLPLQTQICSITLRPTLESQITFLLTFDVCMKTKYQTKPSRKLFNFQIAHANNFKSKVLNFTQEFPNSIPIMNYVDTNWEIMQHNLCTIMDETVP